MIAVPFATRLHAADAAQIAHGVDDGAHRWVLTRSCSLSPRDVARAYVLLCAVSLLVALGFLVAGFGIVLVFCGVELLAMGAALVMFARRVGDGEVVSLSSSGVDIERRRAGAVERHEFPRAWIRVIDAGPHVLLACGGRRIEVGTQVAWARRQRFTQELRQALAAPTHAPT